MKVLASLAVSLLMFAAVPVHAEDESQRDFFEKKVRPALAEHCFKCHGPQRQRGGLRLDGKAAFLNGGDTGPALVPGHPEKSLLVKAIGYVDPDLRMPPKGKLDETTLAHLTKWVREGAYWPEDKAVAGVDPRKEFDLKERSRHWSLQPLHRPEIPAVRNPAWVRQPLDAFLLAKLEEQGLTPAAPADPAAWLRRATFDLTGLPPTPEEIEAFARDSSPQARDKVVDRLLASPHYAERWARHWLDLVRYAETHGHEFDFEIPHAWQYRDYVLRAFDQDLPYDRLVLEHVAGDLLEKPRRDAQGRNESILGTGFWWLGEAKHSPVDSRADQADRLDNQIDVFGKTFLGLTIACARCHDHKFDAISAQDYYALMGYLQSSRQDRAVLDDPAPRLARLKTFQSLQDEAYRLARDHTAARLEARKDFARPALEKLFEGRTGPKDFAAQRERLLDTLRKQRQDQQRAVERAVVFAAADRRDFDHWLPSGEAFALRPAADRVRIDFAGAPHAVEVLPPWEGASDGLRPELVGSLRSPSFEIPRKRIHLRVRGHGLRVQMVLNGLQLIRAPIYGGLAFGVNTPQIKTKGPNGPALLREEDRAWRWHTIDVSMWVGQRAYLEILDDGNGAGALDRVVFNDDGPPPEAPNGLLLDFLEKNPAKTFDDLAAAWKRVGDDLLARWKNGTLTAGAGAPDRVDLLNRVLAVQEDAAFSKMPPATAQRWDALVQRIGETKFDLPAPARGLAMADGSAVDEHLFIRGNSRNLGAIVPRRFLEVFGGADEPAPKTGSGRLELARHMVDPQRTPILPRVIVNRLWHHHFGRGIVRSVDDFGVLGQPPSHPELLDWLATELVRQGWSLKKMHRMIVLSSAYAMSTRTSEAAGLKDADNRLLSRYPVRRLEAEAIRDALLAISGRLDRTRFGPPVPPHLTAHMLGRGRPGVNGPLDGAGRRSIYLGVRRNFLNPMFLAFDYPTPFTTIGRRGVSNVPAQALTMLNNPLVHQQAKLWASRVLGEKGLSAEQRVERMYLAALGRSPTAAERTTALDFLRESGALEARADNPGAWSELGHALFNVKEFLFLQ